LVMKNLKWADFLLSSELSQKFSNYRKDLKVLVTQNTTDKWNTTVYEKIIFLVVLKFSLFIEKYLFIVYFLYLFMSH